MSIVHVFVMSDKLSKWAKMKKEIFMAARSHRGIESGIYFYEP